MVEMRKRTPCICGKEAEHRIGTTEQFVFESKIVVNNVPHFFCDFCKRVSFDGDTRLVSILSNAYKQGLTEVDYEKGGEISMITFKIDVSDEVKKEIERAVEGKVDEIVDGEEFTVIVDEKAVLGISTGDLVEIERVIEKVL
ncbi:hypothetical protein SD70_24815 [Gordoniibacillus kamchatkensis]|uniref:YgiT-type zinc finger domain-containing protein n=2 Tax=Gordoniibacillus kamchatkensis TaxID=1590651 RepID=A0ABR5ACH9_9BACL|nr:hypothetical protein SD70_24815 [Paenibacillus sp. VKM B-2647]